MILTLAFPSSSQRTGGVVALYEYTNALARRGHEVHFAHGPAWPTRVDRLDEIPFRFDDRVRHHLVDTIDDPALPDGDVVFLTDAPARLGEPCVIVQGYRMLSEEWERRSFRARAPKVCVASWLVDVGVGFGVPREQLWHVPLGMDHGVFTRRAPLDRRSFDVAMLYHTHPEKGWDVGLATLEELRRRVPGLRAVVFSLIDRPEGLPADVSFVKGLDHRGLADVVYNTSRVFVQPSHHEGFGFPAVEAMACGAALVTTDNGGSRDYAVPGETAVVVPPGDPLALADAAHALLLDDARRVRTAEAGARFVRRFDWGNAAEILESRLEAYLADPGALQHEPADDTRQVQ